MLTADVQALAQEIMNAYAHGRIIPVPPSARIPRFDLATAYAVEAELVRLRRAGGRATVGRKVGYANRAMWRVLKLETLLWAHMYDDTVRFAATDRARLSTSGMCAPRIEPEIVFKLKGSLDAEDRDPAAVLHQVEWMALGFEIVDCVFPDWKYQPADFVAAFGLHAALIVGKPRPVASADVPTLVDRLPHLKVRLLKNSTLVQEGSGQNALRSPALCLGELAAALSRNSACEPLAPGEIISTGALTDAQPIAPGETWMAATDSLELPSLAIDT